ncbi:hypothetical protein SAMN04488514_1313, partial [Kriegella aquimaris]
GTGTAGDPYVLTSIDSSDGSETEINSSATVTVAGTGTSADPYILTSTGGADGSETIIDSGASSVIVSGDGTSGDPYILTNPPSMISVTYPLTNDGTVTTPVMITADGIDASHIGTGAVTSDEILNATINLEDLDDMGATTTGQVIKWNQTTPGWEIGNDEGALPTGTPGGIFFSDGSAGLDDDPTNLSWDAVNNRLRSFTFATPGGNSSQPGYGFSTNNDFDTGMFWAANNEIGFATGSNEAIRIDASQNVGIGTSTPDTNRKLHVAGNLQVDGEVWVGLTQEHPDYVFQKYYSGKSNLNPRYDFKKLTEIEAFIKKHHHLPGIKSAVQVKKEGSWNVSESNLQNLEKIEELFLHTINQEKEIKKLKNQNETLSSELETLKKDMAEIKALLKK